jgi:hypothetical protein
MSPAPDEHPWCPTHGPCGTGRCWLVRSLALPRPRPKPSRLEVTFRRFATGIAMRAPVPMPPAVYDSVVDHLSRTDSTGATLCFSGPLREQVLDLLMAWIRTSRRPGDQLTLF